MLQEVNFFALVWDAVGWAFPLILIITGGRLAFSARAQGWLGERFVGGDLEKHAHAALHDVILPNGRGGLTQIDHVLLTDQGIRVIETKTLTGRIFGRERDRQWTQRLGRKSFRIGNPLRQNYGHLKAVEALVAELVPVLGHVVMAGAPDFPKGMPVGVSTRRQLKKELSSARTGHPLPESWIRAWSELESHVRTDPEARKSHRAQIEGRYGRDLRPLFGMVMLGAGLLLAGWIFLT